MLLQESSFEKKTNARIRRSVGDPDRKFLIFPDVVNRT